MVNCRGGGH